MTRMLTAARALREAGLSFIPSYPQNKSPAWHLLPILTDDAGQPVINPRNEKPKREWRSFMQRQPTPEEIETWFGNGRLNLAVVCGRVSGNLQVLDFDYDAAETFPQWQASINPDLLDRLTVIQTGKGYQVYFRVPDYDEMPSNKILARKPGDKPKSYKVLIELLSEGSLCTTAPSYHAAAKRHYRAIQGSLLAIPDLTVEEAESLIAAAKRLTKVQERTTATFSGQRVVTSTLAFARMDKEKAEAYANGALRNITSDLARSDQGGRNHRLNESAFWLARYIAAGLLSESVVAASLEDACQANGLIADDGLSSFQATLQSGFEAGLRTPMTEAEIMDRLSSGTADPTQALQNIHPPLTKEQYDQVKAVVKSVQQDALWQTFHNQMTDRERREWSMAYHVTPEVVSRYWLGMTSEPVTTVSGLSIPSGAFTVPFCDIGGNVREIEFRNGPDTYYQIDSMPTIHYIPPFFEEDEPEPETPLILMMDSVTAILAYMHYGTAGDFRFGALPHAPLRPESLRDNYQGEIYLLVGTETNTAGRGLPLLANAGVRVCRLPLDARSLHNAGFTIDDLRHVLESS